MLPCSTDIDECLVISCHNGGTCTDGVNEYTCECVAGYTGMNCETGEQFLDYMQPMTLWNLV